jgi:hypothetical protein
MSLIGLWWVMSMAVAGPLLRVAPAGRDGIGVAFGDRWLPRASTLQPAQADCGDGMLPVKVLVVNPWYRKQDVVLAQTGQEGCVAANDVVDAGGPDGSERAEAVIRMAFAERFGPISADRVISSPWGRVVLPMVRDLDESERKHEFEREHLETPAQRERATDAVGPSRDGVPVYSHFLGSDAPRSDRWGTPDLIYRLLALFDGWATHCRETLPATITEARPETCRVQVGDLGWYSDYIPDPLGHLSHFKGNCADIRLFRDDGSAYEAWHNRPDDRPQAKGGYSQPLTLAFVRYVMDQHPPSTLYFNDPGVVSAVAGVRARKGHDDHIHMCF